MSVLRIENINDDDGFERDGDTSQGQTAVVTKSRTQIKRPSMYKVLLHNDDYTPMDFVIEILRKFFHKNRDEATKIMLTVHNNGKAVCGIYPFGIAETKVALVIKEALNSEYPLKCTLEKDDS